MLGKSDLLKRANRITVDKNNLSFNFCKKSEISNDEVIKIAGISRNTYYKYKRELFNEEDSIND